MQQRNAVLVHGNALKLGLFGANCSSGRTYARLAEGWDASWENNLRLAQLADDIGIECMVPKGRGFSRRQACTRTLGSQRLPGL